MPTRADLLPGTLDLLILKAVSLGPLHGYAVLLRIEQMTSGALVVEQGALYPALFRLEHRGLLDTEWGVSDNNRRAKFYRLTTAGRKQLKTERDGWNRLATAMQAAVGEGVIAIGAGNYGGKLGKFHFYLHKLLAGDSPAPPVPKGPAI